MSLIGCQFWMVLTVALLLTIDSSVLESILYRVAESSL